LIRWLRHEAWIDLLELALVAALGVGLANWTWLVVAPHAVSSPGARADVATMPAGARAEREFFGPAQGTPVNTRAGVGPALVLLGVLSEPDTRGRAILSGSGSRPATVSVGEQIADGIVLQEVYPDHVIILRQGVRERIDLERGGQRAAPSPAPVRIPGRR
jgi:general secretion pathway protein C